MSSRAFGACALRSAAAAAWLCACARAPVIDPLAPAFDARGAAHAAELAPDLYGRALSARREAAAARGQDAREKARARAELWLQAALAEAERIDAQRAASAADARTAAAEARRVAAQREREGLERDLALVAAGRSARARAQRMLAGGALAQAAQRGDALALADATAFALERASLLLVAARAMDAAAGSGSGAAALAARLDTLATQADSRSRLRALLQLLADLERALGEARLARPGPSPEERDSLRADAAERGFVLEPLPRGARLTLDAPAFAAGRVEPSAPGVLSLSLLDALLRLHPRGPVELEASSTPLATRRAQALAKRLRAVRSDVRIVSSSQGQGQGQGQGPSTDAVAVVLLAYGTAMPASPTTTPP